MRFTFAEAEEPTRRSGLFVWMRRCFEMIVVGAMALAAAETISFLRHMVG